MDREKSPSLLRYRKYTGFPFLRYARLLSRDFLFALSTGVIAIISHKPTSGLEHFRLARKSRPDGLIQAGTTQTELTM
jgi:hypothetical protein